MAVECPESVRALPFPPGFNAWDPRLNGEDLLVVMKSRRCVGLYSDGVLRGGPDGGAASCWRVALGAHVGGKEPTGPKEAEGDLRTPEGWYRTSDKPRSRFFHAIRVHYPNLQDADRALATGRIDQLQHDAIRDALASDDVPPQGTPLGGEVLLHGGGSSADWTLGSIALEDDDIDELRALLPAQMRTDLLILP